MFYVTFAFVYGFLTIRLAVHIKYYYGDRLRVAVKRQMSWHISKITRAITDNPSGHFTNVCVACRHDDKKEKKHHS